jgi:predicted O-linked N-acetylglucosamine transferase (SPINDLY family)
VAASTLKAARLPELVSHSLAEYEALALRLAREPGVLTAIKQRLAQERQTLPLFGTARFSRHLESAYRTMWMKARNGEPPSHFAVPAQP